MTDTDRPRKGRPRPKPKVVKTTLPDDLWSYLHQAAASRYLTPAAYIRQLIADDRAQKMGAAESYG